MDLKRRILVEIDGTGAKSGADKVNNSLQSIERQAKQMSSGGSRAFDDLKGSVGGLSKVIPLVASGLAALKIGELVKDSALLAARYDTLGVVMNTVGMNAGYTSGQMAAFEAGLQKTGISMIESRNNLARMAQANIDLSKSSELARIAQDAAVIGNINSSQAFERLVYGIQSGQTEVLKTIGIQVNFEQSYKKLSAEIGKTSKQLTENEKMQARVNSVMESGADIAGVYSGAMETAGKQITSLDRLTENASTKLGTLFQPALVTGVKLYTAALVDVNEQLDSLISYFDRFNNPTDVVGVSISTIVSRIDKENQAILDAEKTIGGAFTGPGTQAYRDAQMRVYNSQQIITDLRTELVRLNDEGRVAIRQANRRKEDLSAEESAAAALLDKTTEQTEAERMLLSVREDIAKLTLSENDFEKFQLSAEYQNLAKELGAANPQLQQWLKLKERDLELTQMAKLDPYQVTQLERMNQGDSFFGKADADKRSLEMLNDQGRENLQLQTEFSEKYREIVLGETEFKLDQIRLQGEAYVKAGSDEVAVAQWVAQEKLKASRDWEDGVMRGLKSYADEATNAAQLVEGAITSGFGSMTDALVDFAVTGKGSFADFADSVIRDMIRITAQQNITGPLASGLGSLISGLFSGGSSASVMPSGGAGLYYSQGHHAGGIVGIEPTFVRPVPASAYANAPRYHDGFLPDEYPAILKKDEGVFTPGQMKAMGGSNVTVNVIEAPGQGGRQERRQEGGVNIIDVFVEQVKSNIAGDISSGRGQVPAALAKTYGLNRALGSY